MGTVGKRAASSPNQCRRQSRPRLPRPLRLRPEAYSHAAVHPSSADRSENRGRFAPRQYRLEIIGSLTGTDLDTLIATGFVEHSRFRPHASDIWHQTQLESDESESQAADGH